jgi:Putative beta-barrel porin 2
VLLARVRHRVIGRGLQKGWGSLVCALMLLVVTMTTSRAQTPGGQIFYSSPQPLAATLEQMKSGSDPRPTTTEGKLQIADWLVSASLGYGGTYDSNVNATAINPQAVWGASFIPTVTAEYNTGIQRSQLYLNGNVIYYPSIGRVNLNGTQAGLIHVWEIQRDLIFRFQTQVAEVQAGSSFNNFLTSGIYATTPLSYTQAFGSSSIQKEFGLFFTAIGGSITGTKYQNTTDNLGNVINEQFQDGTVSTVNYRFGFHLTPLIYTYVEPSYNWTNYQESNLDSHGYRVVGGIGSGLISLFSGEIYGGYLKQMFENPTIGDQTSPVVGGRLSWFPTRFLTIAFNADENFGTTDSNALAFTPGTPTKITTIRASVNYDFSNWYALTTSISDQRQNFLDSSRVDSLLSYNAGIIFKLRPGFGLQVGYTHQDLYSNFPGVAYSRDMVTVGGSTKF